MKAPIIALAVVVLSLGVVAGAVFGLGDEEIFVQPPARVAEEFVRAIALGQVGAARAMLSRDAARRTTSDELRRLSEELRARAGRIEHVEGTVAERRRDTVIVRARIEGERTNARPGVALVRESGEWAIARASDIVSLGDSAQSEHRP